MLESSKLLLELGGGEVLEPLEARDDVSARAVGVDGLGKAPVGAGPPELLVPGAGAGQPVLERLHEFVLLLQLVGIGREPVVAVRPGRGAALAVLALELGFPHGELLQLEGQLGALLPVLLLAGGDGRLPLTDGVLPGAQVVDNLLPDGLLAGAGALAVMLLVLDLLLEKGSRDDQRVRRQHGVYPRPGRFRYNFT
jgi:hypothetical protein